MTADNRFGGSEARALAWCLEALEHEGLTLEECLCRFPEMRAELEPLLSMAMALRAAPHVAPSNAFRRAARQRLVRHLRLRQSLGRGTSALARIAPLGLAHLKTFFRAAPVWRAMAALALCVLTGTGVASASNTALPGDVLYPVKTTLEHARLAFSPDDPETVRLHLDFAERRIGEIQTLLEVQRFEDIPEPLRDFEDHVVKSSQTLAQVVAEEDPQARILAEQVLADLNQDADTLLSIQETTHDNDEGLLRQTIALTQAHGSFTEWLLSGGIQEPLPSGTEETPAETSAFCWPEELQGMAPEGIPTCAQGQGPWSEPTYPPPTTETPEGEIPRAETTIPDDTPTPDEAETPGVTSLPPPFPDGMRTPTGTPIPSQTDSTLHVADLDASSHTLDASSWEEVVLITVHGGSHQTVEGIRVSGTWLDFSSGRYQDVECITDAGGSCSVFSGPIDNPDSLLIFMISDLYETPMAYDALENHDPDGDSDGSVILVTSP